MRASPSISFAVTMFSSWLLAFPAVAAEEQAPPAQPKEDIFNPLAPGPGFTPGQSARPPAWATPEPEPAPRFIAPMDEASMQAGCATRLLCFKLRDAAPGMGNQPLLYALAALLPFGGVWGPMLLVDQEFRPAFEGGLRLVVLFHTLVPLVTVGVAPLLGFLLGGVVGGVLTAAVLAVFYGGFFGIFGAVAVPFFGGGVVGAVGGVLFGAIFGLIAGAVWTAPACGLLSGLLAMVTTGIWQLYLGPVTMLRSWDRAIREQAYERTIHPESVERDAQEPATH